MTVYETYELVNLAAAHFGHWLVEYDFSLASSPNKDPEAEADAWLDIAMIQDRTSRVPRTGETTHTDAA
jgi:hypothetical protein